MLRATLGFSAITSCIISTPFIVSFRFVLYNRIYEVVGMVFKIITSIVFIAVFIARIVKPEWNIDTTSIILLILAFVPWFIQYIKTLEISGLGKVELVGKEQKKEIDKKASEAGILKSDATDNEKYTFYGLRYNDP